MVMPVWWQLFKLCGFLLHTIGRLIKSWKTILHSATGCAVTLFSMKSWFGDDSFGSREVNSIFLQLGWPLLPFPEPRKTQKGSGSVKPASPAGPSSPLWLCLYWRACGCRRGVEKQQDFVRTKTKWPTAWIRFFPFLPRMRQISPFLLEMNVWSGHGGSAWNGGAERHLAEKGTSGIYRNIQEMVICYTPSSHSERKTPFTGEQYGDRWPKCHTAWKWIVTLVLRLSYHLLHPASWEGRRIRWR